MTIRIQALFIAAAVTLAPLAATAQTSGKADAPMTAPSTGPQSGSAPGNAGSSGWSGSGLGGSHTGMPNDSKSGGQPETVQGVNPQPSTTGSNTSGSNSSSR